MEQDLRHPGWYFKRLIVIDMGQGLIKLINPKIIKQEGHPGKY